MRRITISRFGGLGSGRAVIFAVFGIVLCLAVAGPTAGSPQVSSPGDPASTRVSNTPGQDDLPQEPISLSSGVVTNSQGAVARRSKLYITVGPNNPIWGAIYIGLHNMPVEDPTSYLATCSRGRPCAPDPFYQPACATDDPATQAKGAYWRAALYPLSPLKSGGASVGVLAKIPIKLVAFGSIPATATLTMSVPRVGGKVAPLTVHVWQQSLAADSRGCDPTFTYPVSTLVDGEVNLTLSDLRVDGVAVDLGPACSTARPASLQLWSEGDYTPGGGGQLAAYDGLHPGSRGVLDDSPLYRELRGRRIAPSTGITVPAFKGCGANGEKLDGLVTAMASGTNNPVRVVQKQNTPADPDPIDLNNLARCHEYPPELNAPPECPLPAPGVPARPPLPAGED